MDAMGRNFPLAGLLGRIGPDCPVEQRDDVGFVYYYAGNYASGVQGCGLIPLMIVPPRPCRFSRSSAKGGTVRHGHGCGGQRRAAASPARRGRVERVLALFPDFAAARSVSVPITGVQVMARGSDRHLSFERGGRPVVTGVVPVGMRRWGPTQP
jgi:hypothetical protein